MIKLITILGARPQFIKAVAISTAIRTKYGNNIRELILHTGQHFDENMSDVFFEELGLPKPHFRLHAASSDKPLQSGVMIDGIADILQREKPHVVMVYGDTTSTMAGAIAASSQRIPIVHIEAGLRSYNKSMPEELNRIICDQLSTLLFSPTPQGVQNLAAEGIRYRPNQPVKLDNPGVFECGDVMMDVARIFADKVSSLEWKDIGLNQPSKRWILFTLHREQNTSNKVNLTQVLESILNVLDSQNCEIIWPLHPRTRKALIELEDKVLKERILKHAAIHFCNPLSYLQTQFLLRHCNIVLTDSGGLQKEAYFAGKPSVIMRNETEWVELLQDEYAILCDTDKKRMHSAVEKQWNKAWKNGPDFYGNGHAAESILDKIVRHLNI